ncbi:MAG TPA: hypothetical protein VKY36_02320 [Moheibacter sp.]|nr:hypothetical protein [Moheibacter sp.]
MEMVATECTDTNSNKEVENVSVYNLAGQQVLAFAKVNEAN